MADPEVVGLRALLGKRIGISVSESADLQRLGLSEFHCRLVIAEVSRALFLAGATVVYGGRFGPDGYTEILINEAERFGGSTRVLELFFSESEYSGLSREDLEGIDQGLGEHGQVRLVSVAGQVVDIASAVLGQFDRIDTTASLTSLRTIMANHCDARFLLGGRLEGYLGVEPGVIEEARISLESGKPVLAAAGYGGAAAVVAMALFGWHPENWPDDLPESPRV